MNIDRNKIPWKVTRVTELLEKAGFEAYLVGGCTRDLLRGAKPKDWDITTSAKPEEIMTIFGEEEAFYENDFGTVTIKNEDDPDPSVHNVEVTPYRLEAKYSNSRHPDSVTFSDKLEEDLKRRDFTINAIAYSPISDKIVDLYNGQKDISNKIIRAVGDPLKRFQEDALRVMRAIRLSTELEYTISHETSEAILKTAKNLDKIAKERIQTEFTKIIMSPNPVIGLNIAQKLGVLRYIIPELEEGLGCEQNGDHIYEVWEHNLRALGHSAFRNWPFHVRLGALLHDVGKPKTRVWSDEKKDWTFYGHDVVGARMTRQIMKRLKYPKKTTEMVVKLVRYHLFFTDIDQITLSAVRRIVSRVGSDLVWDLMNIRACDRIGMGRPKEKPYRLRKYESMIEEATRAPVSVGMLKIDGSTIMDVARETPGPRVGWILHALLEEVLDDPSRNTEEYLKNRAKSMAELTDKELRRMGEQGKEKRDETEEAELIKIRKKYGVK